jgi:hypothetical protein
MVDPKLVHLIAVKHVMRYLKGTMDYGLDYVADSEISLIDYIFVVRSVLRCVQRDQSIVNGLSTFQIHIRNHLQDKKPGF